VGNVFVSVGLIVSVLGAYLAWTLMAAKVLFVAANDEDMPRFLRRKSAADVPTALAADVDELATGWITI
jgi:arginine:ornithine antiporter / lysine permease